jgi:hypothetical protein
MSDDTSLRMIQIVLHWAWDPIGVRGIKEAADEYDMYAPQVLEMLKAGFTAEQTADYLTSVVRDRMELSVRPDLDHAVVANAAAAHRHKRVNRTVACHQVATSAGQRQLRKAVRLKAHKLGNSNLS